jgi:subtilase family serine protease
MLNFRRSWLIIGLGVTLLFGPIGSSFAAGRQLLHGHIPEAVSHLQPMGRFPGTNRLYLAIGLSLRNQESLDHLLQQIYDPASPNFRQYLTPEQFTERFGPTEQDYQAVIDFAKRNGLMVTGTHGNRVLLDVSGSVANIEKAFHVTLRLYQHPRENRKFFAPDAEPSVDLDVSLADISGLSDYSLPHPKSIRFEPSAITSVVTPRNGSGSGGTYVGTDFQNAYVPGTALNGAGQMVGLVEFDGFYSNDIVAYENLLPGSPRVSIQTNLLDGFGGKPTTGANSGNAEVSLDIEMAIAMAPGLAKIVVFEGNPTNGHFIPNDVLNSMAASYLVRNLSCSWGWSGGPQTTTENIFLEMAAQGQSFFNATGDSDAFTVGSNSTNGVDNTSLPNTPSSSPNITQVGGTTLTMSGLGAAYASETNWNRGYVARDGQYEGSSGGISSYYSLPAWQQGISMTANLGSTTQRNIPDVALTAENVYVKYGNGTNATFGGTSCAAPLWAGFMALVNQQAAAAGRAAIGFANPSLYALAKGTNYASCFHDITAGNNFWSSSPANYPATTGYDLCTGWGTPAGTNLINALVGLAGTSIVQNGGFETGNFNGWTLVGNTTNGSTIYNAVVSAGSFGDNSGTNFIHSGTYGAFLGDNQIATLSQKLNTFPGQIYLLSFWLDNPTNGSVQQFLVNWNTNSPGVNRIYYLTNPPVMPWTNIAMVVTATGTNTTLQFGAENVPDGFGLDDITVTPLPAILFQTVTKTNGTLNFTWNALTGLVYQVQYKTNLLQTNWINLGNAITATNSTATATNLIGPDLRRFYRLQLLY